ncbi:NnrU family protein [Alisedimentitalea sp. MJ-SS2]|uniref:NnrU family protein n=1 Tax=Aliisedimentitalea sp. MJ-SS2 TaxID=3049795 RepID=UPI00290E35C9|nr:NnrU family protein [Alisedimentitalea sp. MJ-SS2]MDU8926157.1 NnrU family protein [Alisedimentitalea sp. MJ-SS2]
MTLLILGVLLWFAAHLFKRIAPGIREPMGEKGKGPVALAILTSIVLMVIGYRMADGPVYWGRTPILAGINNLLVLFSIYLFAADGMKTRAKGWFRNPQLSAFTIWAVAHLIPNGDTESFVLFGGLTVWALISMILLNRANPRPAPPPPAPMGKEIGALVGAIGVYGVVALIHSWLGYNPFG